MLRRSRANAGAYFIGYLGRLDEFFDAQGDLSGTESAALNVAIQEAWDTYVGLFGYTITGASGSARSPSARIAGVYPNPFNPDVTIEYVFYDSGPARLEVFDVAGRRVRVLFDGAGTPGAHSAHWDGNDDMQRPLPSGVYFLRLKSATATSVRKVVLMK
jgi:hypothetical protein